MYIYIYIYICIYDCYVVINVKWPGRENCRTTSASVRRRCVHADYCYCYYYYYSNMDNEFGRLRCSSARRRRIKRKRPTMLITYYNYRRTMLVVHMASSASKHCAFIRSPNVCQCTPLRVHVCGKHGYLSLSLSVSLCLSLSLSVSLCLSLSLYINI